jgi:N-glycosylase/DNA lyase
MAAYRDIDLILKEYRLKKRAIGKRLKGFDKRNTFSEKRLFEELAFCIFTPGSKALNGNRAVKELKKRRLLFGGNRYNIAKALRGIVRFHNNKALYLTQAREVLKKAGSFKIKSILSTGVPIDIRKWLVVNIKGISYKEASHFLRNIGMGSDLAILDTHILKNLKRFNIIKKIPPSLNRKAYLGIERRMRVFSRHVNIPLDVLDLLFWSRETGFIYK